MVITVKEVKPVSTFKYVDLSQLKPELFKSGITNKISYDKKQVLTDTAQNEKIVHDHCLINEKNQKQSQTMLQWEGKLITLNNKHHRYLQHFLWIIIVQHLYKTCNVILFLYEVLIMLRKQGKL